MSEVAGRASSVSLEQLRTKILQTMSNGITGDSKSKDSRFRVDTRRARVPMWQHVQVCIVRRPEVGSGNARVQLRFAPFR
jgi:hypothetical protein